MENKKLKICVKHIKDRIKQHDKFHTSSQVFHRLDKLIDELLFDAIYLADIQGRKTVMGKDIDYAIKVKVDKQRSNSAYTAENS